VNAQVPQAYALLLEEDLQHGEEKSASLRGGWPDAGPPPRGLGPARVDHHQLAAAFAQVVEPARDATAVIKLPFEASGFAPRTRKKRVRSTSGTGNST